MATFFVCGMMFLPWAKQREFLFERKEEDRIFLSHPTGAYEWDTEMENIDWSRKPQALQASPPKENPENPE